MSGGSFMLQDDREARGVARLIGRRDPVARGARDLHETTALPGKCSSDLRAWPRTLRQHRARAEAFVIGMRVGDEDAHGRG
jgi:hypothetical protein